VICACQYICSRPRHNDHDSVSIAGKFTSGQLVGMKTDMEGSMIGERRMVDEYPEWVF